MLSKNIFFKNFDYKTPNKQNKKISLILKELITEKNQIIKSLSSSYTDSFNKKLVLKFKKKTKVFLIGMGGSILGAKAIYNFLRPKLKKFFFIDSFQDYKKITQKNKIDLNLVISKSGNTLETISNSNVLINHNQSNIFITENKKNYLMGLANKLKADVVYHNNFIGGRYSVLSEVGMLPAELMGYSSKKFRRLNDLIKNKRFFNLLVENVSSILICIKKKKFNSVILNYDEQSTDLFFWYQQLVAESLGKKGKGIFPIISKMPKDNHSLMQYYLDGRKNNFYTFFFTKENFSKKIKNEMLFSSHNYLRNKSLNQISYSQFLATERVFKEKKIPFRSFLIKKRNEQTLGELFTFFILETILLGQAIKINPFDQPAVELIKSETKKSLIRI